MGQSGVLLGLGSQNINFNFFYPAQFSTLHSMARLLSSSSISFLSFLHFVCLNYTAIPNQFQNVYFIDLFGTTPQLLFYFSINTIILINHRIRNQINHVEAYQDKSIADGNEFLRRHSYKWLYFEQKKAIGKTLKYELYRSNLLTQTNAHLFWILFPLSITRPQQPCNVNLLNFKIMVTVDQRTWYGFSIKPGLHQ